MWLFPWEANCTTRNIAKKCPNFQKINFSSSFSWSQSMFTCKEHTLYWFNSTLQRRLSLKFTNRRKNPKTIRFRGFEQTIVKFYVMLLLTETSLGAILLGLYHFIFLVKYMAAERVNQSPKLPIKREYWADSMMT